MADDSELTNVEPDLDEEREDLYCKVGAGPSFLLTLFLASLLLCLVPLGIGVVLPGYHGDLMHGLIGVGATLVCISLFATMAFPAFLVSIRLRRKTIVLTDDGLRIEGSGAVEKDIPYSAMEDVRFVKRQLASVSHKTTAEEMADYSYVEIALKDGSTVVIPVSNLNYAHHFRKWFRYKP